MQADTYIAELEHVTFRYTHGGRIIFDDVTLRIPKGKITALMGSSGGGKTTVLRLISGLAKAEKGVVRFDEYADVGKLNNTLLRKMRRAMGMQFQFGALLTDLTVFENVAYPLREHCDLPEAMVRDLVLFKLNAVGLRGAHALLPNQLSGGMARRVAMARAIVLDPKLVLYDEPFAGLDPIALGISAQLIRNLNDQLSLTSIVVSHDIDETFAIADYVYILSDGKVIASGTPSQVCASSDPLIQQFIGGKAEGPVQFHYPAVSIQHDFLHGKRA